MAEGAGDFVDVALDAAGGGREEALGDEERSEVPSSPDRAVERALDARRFRQAAELCARHHGPALGRLCLAMLGAQSEAEEVAQETLLAAYRGFASFEKRSSVRAWLFGIARKKCLKHLERRATQQRRLVLVNPSAPIVEGEDELLARQRAERARAALERLSADDREALSLRYVGDLSHAELAAALGVDESTARKRVSRALGRLRSVVTQRRAASEEA